MTQVFFTFPISILSNGITQYSLSRIIHYVIVEKHKRGESIDEIVKLTCARKKWVEEHLNAYERDDIYKWKDYCVDVYDKYCKCKVMTAINRDRWWEWYEEADNESDYSKIKKLAFLAAKSIVGKKKYCLTNYDMLLSRMAGYEKPQYDKITRGKNAGKKFLRLPEHLKPCNTRRKRDALRDDLSRFHISWWSDRGTRGFYLSSTKIQRKKLYKLIKESKHESIDEKRRKNKDRIREDADHEGEEGATDIVVESLSTPTHERIVNSLLKNTTALNLFCLQNGINVDEFTAIAHEVVNDWELQGTTHTDETDARKHLLNTIRIKLNAQTRCKTHEEQVSDLYASVAATIARRSAEDDARAAKGVDNSDISNLIW